MTSIKRRMAKIRMRKKLNKDTKSSKKELKDVDMVSCKPYGKNLLCEFHTSDKEGNLKIIKRNVKVKHFDLSGDINLSQISSGFVAVNPQKTNNLKCSITKNIVGEDVLDCFEKQKSR